MASSRPRTVAHGVTAAGAAAQPGPGRLSTKRSRENRSTLGFPGLVNHRFASETRLNSPHTECRTFHDIQFFGFLLPRDGILGPLKFRVTSLGFTGSNVCGFF